MNRERRTIEKVEKPKKKLSRQQIEKKKKMIIRTFFTTLTLIVLFIIAIVASNFIILGKNKTTNLVINNNNVTLDLKNEIIIENDIIYLSKQDIGNFFDKYIYEDTETNKIITTYDKKIAAIGFEGNTININGSNKEIYASAVRKDDKIYLPISEMKDVYGIEIEHIEDTKVVTIDSLSREQKKAIATSNVAVKTSARFIGKTIDRIKKGENVIVISSTGKYTKIRTEDGKIGYVKSKKIDNEITVREKLENEKQIQGKVNLVWDYFSEVASAPDRSGTQIEGLNVVSPSFFYIDSNGDFKENVGQKGKNYIEWAHENGYKVWPMVANAGGADMLEVTSKIMNSYTKRQELIDNIVNVCVKYRLDGINVDFENMKKEDKDLYSRFIIELTPRLKEMGLVTSVDVTAPDGSDTWSMCFDRHVIGDVADYIIFMAYDEYGASSTTPGTTAGYDWVKLSLNKFLTTEEIEPDKIILGIPFYTRVWTTNPGGKIVGNKTVDMKNVDNVIPKSAQKEWKEDLKQNYVEYKDGSNTKRIWIEDIESLKAKISLVKENNLAGVAGWQKGMETDEVWTMIKTELGM